MARTYSTALWMYDLAGGWRIGKRHGRMTADDVASHLPTLRTDRLVAGFVYYDARTDDARLTLAVMRTAVLEHAAVAVNYAPAVGFCATRRGVVAGIRIAPIARASFRRLARSARARAAASGELEVRAKVVVNATGVWADELRLLDDPGYRAVDPPRQGDPSHRAAEQAAL